MLSLYKNDQCICKHVIKADTLMTRMIGLLRHKHLDDDQALWLLPCNSIHTFFMRFSIDAIFLNKNLIVIKTYEHIKPFRLTKVMFQAHSVIEVPSGKIQRSNICVKDQLTFYESKHGQ